MLFEYLGTAAAEGWPAMFCSCDACRRAVKEGGRNIRSRSQALIDKQLLIDFPADTCMRVLEGKLDLPSIRHCLITHNHSDHLYAADLEMRRFSFAYPSDDRPMVFYATEFTGSSIRQIIGECNLAADNRVLFKPVVPFEPFAVDRYTVTALPANHCEDSVFFMIDDGEKTILYAHDTGYFPEESWQYLEKTKPHFSFLSLDCTTGPVLCRNGHMGLSTDHEVCERLSEIGCIDSKTTIYVNHFSHNGGAIYDELIPLAAEYGFSVSYDGCQITI